MKINETTMREQYDGQYKTFCKKNSDYGDSFELSLDKHGIVASIVRMDDKMKRLEALTDESRTQQVGSESLLDTLEDLSNYAAMTACWLKGIQEEDEVSGSDMEDVIKYNIQDAKDTMARSIEMEKEFNKHVSSKIENIDPRNYVLNMLSNIFRVVGKKIEKDEMLVPIDISDEAGLIAKAIVESKTEEEGVAVINNYMCSRKDIPYELKDWIYGIIMRNFYYLKKERSEEETICIMGDDMPILIRKNGKDIIPDDDNVVDAMRYCAEDMMNDPIIRKRINEEIISYSLDAIIELMVDDIKRQRDPKVKLDERQRIVDQRQKYYEKIARFIRIAPNIEFEDFEGYFNTRADLHSYEKALILEGILEELHSQIDKELEKFNELFFESLESNSNSITVKQAVEVRLISEAMNDIMSLLVPNVLAQRNPKYDVNAKLTQAKQRNEWYKEIAKLILSTPGLSFDGFSGYVDTFRELMPDEKQLIKEGVATEIYSLTDKNPEGEEESEFRSKTFNIPTEEISTENLTFKPQDEEKEPINEKMFKAFLWLFHPIIDKDYRGSSDE